MVWLGFGAFAVVALYFWLRGHWFVRVLAFLGMVPVLGLVGFLVGAALQNNPVPHPEQFPFLGIIGMLSGIAAAWPLSGLPSRYHRAKALAADSAASSRRDAAATFHAPFFAVQHEPQRRLQRDF